ncbi:MAG: helix-hairpin-helix domain-containing protein [Candidatus Methanoperedens sp.]|nr:helix-hairpin-helix domain-containing protein [Candidatus Methanoperedens sp.]
MITTLKSIPRIGDKTALRLIKHFGSEKQALDAILNKDIAALSEVEGVTEKSAISLVLDAMALNEGAGMRDFLKTGEAFEIYERIMELIKGFAHTGHARSKLNLYFPYPSHKKDKIIKLQREIGNIIEMTGKLDDNKLSSLLSKIKPIKTNFNISIIRDRAIIATSAEEFEAAKKFPVSVQLVSDTREAVDVARGYSHVIISTSLAGMDFPEDIDIDFMDIKKAEIWQVAPEKELSFFTRNHESISCAITVLRSIRQRASDFCDKIKDEEIERLSSGLMKLSKDNDLKSGLDNEIDRCSYIHDRLNDVVTAAERQANLEFGSLIEKSSITIKGFDLLTAMDGSINQLFEKEIREKYNTATANALRAVAAELGLNPREAQYIDNLFGDEASHPIKVNPRSIEGLKNHLQRIITSRKLVLLRENARALSTLKENASYIVREVLDFDVGYTIACFARKYSLNMPLLHDNNGIGIIGGSNLFLENAVPINYAVGVSHTNSGIGKLKDARVVLLSGVNSGGKTSTLELLAQVVVLAHMGFPVPAKQSELGLVEEFYYFGKSKGTMDAGVFESTIKDFSAVANNKSKIVLTDEMESITEPGASAKIISGILEELDDNNGLGVFVSHVAESILKNTDRNIRVDGIEAKGLDEQHNLIVDRNPRYNYLARSTPELIVERLARKNKDNEFYGRLLKKFK